MKEGRDVGVLPSQCTIEAVASWVVPLKLRGKFSFFGQGFGEAYKGFAITDSFKQRFDGCVPERDSGQRG